MVPELSRYRYVVTRHSVEQNRIDDFDPVKAVSQC